MFNRHTSDSEYLIYVHNNNMFHTSHIRVIIRYTFLVV